MIDIHCHLLHGLDDGPADLEEAVLLAGYAAEDGATVVCATPHYRIGRYDTKAKDILLAVDDLNSELKERGIPLRVLGGQEIRAHEEILDGLKTGNLLPLGYSSYVLVEMPSGRLPYRFDEMIHELRIAGWTPIIAHPERNAEIAADPDKLVTLVGNGALCQITSHSLTGRFGKPVKALAWELCRRNLVHLIASDAHNASTRPYELRAAYKALSARLGTELTDYYERNARSVIHDMPVKRRPMQGRRKTMRLFAGWSIFKT
ncbi:tyrosine-protein phosphatase [Paenibacillus nasutitermitis]|uniref:Tyrosine-protein phosphatase n=1 Tax=Paenibacillus nasutitermitis TaxID=1652958 RepID=A0A916YXI9_9BACL|nr:CpsB/CapC family capsule biosynthesis tyrosine phosphatase [Paenibacillus nasutitermitis]GGD65719.1 tyrosine protein phosphatase [Paenibacillus nasutitermitis]